MCNDSLNEMSNIEFSDKLLISFKMVLQLDIILCFGLFHFIEANVCNANNSYAGSNINFQDILKVTWRIFALSIPDKITDGPLEIPFDKSVEVSIKPYSNITFERFNIIFSCPQSLQSSSSWYAITEVTKSMKDGRHIITCKRVSSVKSNIGWTTAILDFNFIAGYLIIYACNRNYEAFLVLTATNEEYVEEKSVRKNIERFFININSPWLDQKLIVLKNLPNNNCMNKNFSKNLAENYPQAKLGVGIVIGVIGISLIFLFIHNKIIIREFHNCRNRSNIKRNRVCQVQTQSNIHSKANGLNVINLVI